MHIWRLVMNLPDSKLNKIDIIQFESSPADSKYDCLKSDVWKISYFLIELWRPSVGSLKIVQVHIYLAP